MTTLRTCWDRETLVKPIVADAIEIDDVQIAVADAIDSLLDWNDFYEHHLDFLRNILRRIEERLEDESLADRAAEYLEYKRGCPEDTWRGNICRLSVDLDGLHHCQRAILLRCCRAYALTLRLLHLRERNMMISPKPAA